MSETAEATVEGWDPLDRLARFPVRTDAECAAYLSMVGGSPGAYRSADEIASEHGVDPEEVEGALRRFVSAGIVEASESGSRDGYRWRDDMGYLEHGRREESGFVDPVCGMPVMSDTPHRLIAPEGGDLGFCCALCLAVFRGFPGAFQKPVSSRPHRCFTPSSPPGPKLSPSGVACRHEGGVR